MRLPRERAAVTPEYDPEKGLWVPGRRRFFLLSGLALAGTVVKGWTLVPADPLVVLQVSGDGGRTWVEQWNDPAKWLPFTRAQLGVQAVARSIEPFRRVEREYEAATTGSPSGGRALTLGSKKL